MDDRYTKIRDAISYAQGVLDALDYRGSGAAQLRRAMDLVTEMMTEAEKEPEPTAHWTQEQPPVQEKIDMVRKPLQTTTGPSILVKDRKECRKCPYVGGDGGTKTCEYLRITGHSRGGDPADCEHWKDDLPKSKDEFTEKTAPKKVGHYRKTCIRCGQPFIASAPRTKLCPKCKGDA